jgi:hypothetical protein
MEILLYEMLKRLSFEEQFFSMKESLKPHFLNKDLTEADKVTRKSGLVTLLGMNGVDKDAHEEWMNYAEDSLTFSEFREERIRLVLNTRILLSQINKSLGLFSRSFHILKHAFNSLSGSIFEDFTIEKGEDPEVQ